MTGRLWKANHLPSGGECVAHRYYSPVFSNTIYRTRGMVSTSRLNHLRGLYCRISYDTIPKEKSYWIGAVACGSSLYKPENSLKIVKNYQEAASIMNSKISRWRRVFSQAQRNWSSGVSRNFVRGGFQQIQFTEDRGQRERGSGGGSPLVRGSGGNFNMVHEISFHIVKFS